MSDADKRTKAIEAVNRTLANVEIAQARMHKAKSEMGAAEKQLRDAEYDYARARHALTKLLPEPTEVGRAALEASRHESNEIAEAILNGGPS